MTFELLFLYFLTLATLINRFTYTSRGNWRLLCLQYPVVYCGRNGSRKICAGKRETWQIIHDHSRMILIRVVLGRHQYLFFIPARQVTSYCVSLSQYHCLRMYTAEPRRERVCGAVTRDSNGTATHYCNEPASHFGVSTLYLSYLFSYNPSTPSTTNWPAL